MKTIHALRQENLKRESKITILQQQTLKGTTLVLGLLAVLFSNSANANSIQRDQQEQASDFALETIHTGDSSVNSLKKQELTLEDEIRFMDSIASYTTQTQREVVRTILENECIIESQEEIDPSVYLNRTTEEVISDDHQIIESNLDDTTYPLDFEAINNNLDGNKNADIKNRVFVKRNLKS